MQQHERAHPDIDSQYSVRRQHPVFKYLLTPGVPPEAISIMRTTFACVMFWFVSLFAPKEKVRPRGLGILFVCGLCGVGINQLLFVIGLNSSSPVDASIIGTAVPIFVLLLAAAVLKEPITAKKSFGVFLGVSGGLLLVFSSAQTAAGANSLWGDTLMLLNQLMYSGYLVLPKPLSLHVLHVSWPFSGKVGEIEEIGEAGVRYEFECKSLETIRFFCHAAHITPIVALSQPNCLPDGEELNFWFFCFKTKQ